MGNEILIKFGKRVRQVRDKSGMSQEKIAELADLHRNFIGLIERGQRNVTLLSIEKIARALKTTPSKLLK